MNNLKKTYRVISVFSLLISTSLFTAFAQTQALPPAPSSPGTGRIITVATVNIYNATSTQNGNTISVSFDITNRVGIQSGVKYGVVLLQDTKNIQTVVDDHVYDEVLNMGENSSVHRFIDYTPPADLNGEFTLVLVSKNTSGLTFGSANLGNVQLIANQNNPLVIDTSSCYLTVEGEKGQPHYTLLQGVDIAPTENLVSNCIVENNSSSSISFSPSFVTRARSNFGDIVTTLGGDVSPVNFAPHEKKMVATVLPKSTVPQAYNVSLKYDKENSGISYHYVIQGGSGTIQNIILDKDGYSKEDTANISFVWSPSADNFPNSRKGKGTNLAETSFMIKLVDENGNLCADPVSQLLGKDPLVHVSLKLTSNCSRPNADVILSDTKFGTLSHVVFGAVNTNIPVVSKNIFSQKNIIYLIIVVAVLFIIYFIFSRKTKVAVPIAPLILIIATGAMFLSPNRVMADSFFYPLDSIGGMVYNASGSVNINKSNYSPGETISASATISVEACTNSNPYSLISMSVNGSSKNLIVSYWTGVSTGSASYTAPSSPGSYGASYSASTYTSGDGAWAGSAAGSIPYNVIAPPRANPSVNINFSSLFNKTKIFVYNVIKMSIDHALAGTIR